MDHRIDRVAEVRELAADGREAASDERGVVDLARHELDVGAGAVDRRQREDRVARAASAVTGQTGRKPEVISPTA